MLCRAMLCYNELRYVKLRMCYALLCCSTQRHVELRSAATRFYAVLRRATLIYAVLLLCALAARRSAIKGVYSVQLHRATRSAIKGVRLATPDPLSKTCASRSIAARRSAIKGVCLATPGPRSRTIALSVRLCFAVLVLRFNDTRFPLPLLTQISSRVETTACSYFHSDSCSYSHSYSYCCYFYC